MEKIFSASTDPPRPTAPTRKLGGADGHANADKLDAGLLRIAGVCALALMMASLDSTVVSVAQRTFVNHFGSTQAIVGWTMTGYTLAMATVIPITGWAADRFGTKRLFMGAALTFTLGSLLCAMASPNILLLIIFRILQGVGAGMLVPLVFMIVTREAGSKRLGRLMAMLAIVMMLGPIDGPILGGWLIGAYGWKWIFLVNLPIGLAAFVLAAIVLRKDRPAPSETFDSIGVLLLSPGLATFLFGVSSIPGRGTVADRHVLVPTTIGLALIIAFVLHALYRADRPLVDLRLFKNRVVTHANATMLVFAATFWGAFLLVPSYFQHVLHQTTLQSAVHLIPQGLGAMLTMPFAGHFVDKRGPGSSVLLGIALITAGLGIFAFGVATRTDYLPTLLAGLVVMGLGMGCLMMQISGAALRTLAQHQIASGSTLINVNQQMASAIGITLMSMILTNQLDRSENIAAANNLALQQNPPRRGAPVYPAANVLHDLSHAYTTVFVLAVALMATAIIPAAFLAKKPRQTLTLTN